MFFIFLFADKFVFIHLSLIVCFRVCVLLVYKVVKCCCDSLLFSLLVKVFFINNRYAFRWVLQAVRRLASHIYCFQLSYLKYYISLLLLKLLLLKLLLLLSSLLSSLLMMMLLYDVAIHSSSDYKWYSLWFSYYEYEYGNNNITRTAFMVIGCSTINMSSMYLSWIAEFYDSVELSEISAQFDNIPWLFLHLITVMN